MPSESVTLLLEQLSGGDRHAFDALMPLVYDQLRKIASGLMLSERGGHTLPATALVHEAYLRLAGSDSTWENRAHFYAVAARVMRRILVLDDAMHRLAQRDPRKSEIVELLFFGGMTYDETAAALGISPATVHRELALVKAWLYRELARPS